MKEDLKITIEDVTHENAVWLKRHEYYLDGKIVGYSTFRKDDRVYVGAFDDPKYGKNVYAGSPEGIAWKMQKRLLPN